MSAIFRKTRAVFSIKSQADGIYDSDLSGPLLFIAALGFSHMLSGKVLFGYIIGWTLLTSMGMSWILNMVVGPGADIGMYACCSVLGYGLLPQVFLALLNVVVGKGVIMNGVAIFCILWSTRVATKFVVGKLRANHIPVEEQRALLAYPWILTFSMFALLSMY